jgi:hypothetical protein
LAFGVNVEKASTKGFLIDVYLCISRIVRVEMSAVPPLQLHKVASDIQQTSDKIHNLYDLFLRFFLQYTIKKAHQNAVNLELAFLVGVLVDQLNIACVGQILWRYSKSCTASITLLASSFMQNSSARKKKAYNLLPNAAASLTSVTGLLLVKLGKRS